MGDFYCEEVLSGRVDVSVVYETNLVLAFHHTKPYFEHHVVIIPKQHIASLSDEAATNAKLAIDFMTAIHAVVSKIEKTQGGCRVSSNVGSYQSTKHLHWYVHAGKRLRNEDGSKV
jgi:histidine triad (HIT) family protein